jgi:hypothetical protein
MQRYAILRNVAAGRRTASPFETLGPSITAAGVPEPQVDVQVLERNEVVDIAGDPQVQSLAPIMPTALIRPLEAGVAPTQGDAWGIAAVQAESSSCTGDGVVVAILDTGIDKPIPHSMVLILPSRISRDRATATAKATAVIVLGRSLDATLMAGESE